MSGATGAVFMWGKVAEERSGRNGSSRLMFLIVILILILVLIEGGESKTD